MSGFRIPSLSEIRQQVDTLEYLEQIELSNNPFYLEVLIEKMQRYATMLQYHLSYSKNLMRSEHMDLSVDRDMLTYLVSYAQARITCIRNTSKYKG